MTAVCSKVILGLAVGCAVASVTQRWWAATAAIGVPEHFAGAARHTETIEKFADCELYVVDMKPLCALLIGVLTNGARASQRLVVHPGRSSSASLWSRPSPSTISLPIASRDELQASGTLRDRATAHRELAIVAA
jgi:hypothetical protein